MDGWLDRALISVAVVLAVAGMLLCLLLLLVTPLAATAWDAAGLAGVGLAFAAVPWAAVWAMATGRWPLAGAALVLLGAGFAAVSRDGFPSLPPAVVAFAVAAACGWRWWDRAGRDGTDERARTVACRTLGTQEADHVKWALYEAVSWNPDRPLPPYEALIEHPELARYHRDWGREGDLGILAERDGERVGVAFCRLFTDGDHGHGYVDEATPELAVAVGEAQRASGIGTRLMLELAAEARRAGFARLSLSVDGDNPALRLYERLGYRELARDDGGVRMLLDL